MCRENYRTKKEDDAEKNKTQTRMNNKREQTAKNTGNATANQEKTKRKGKKNKRNRKGLKGKGRSARGQKGPKGKRESGARLDFGPNPPQYKKSLAHSFARTHARTNETKRFPGWVQASEQVSKCARI